MCHTVKIEQWVNGILNNLELEFRNFEEAIDEASKYLGHVKIYNPKFELVYSEHHGNTPSVEEPELYA